MRLRTTLMAMAAMATLLPTRARPELVPPADSRAAVYLQVSATLERVQKLDIPALRDATATGQGCLSTLGNHCTAERLQECQQNLAELFDQVRKQQSEAAPFLSAALSQAATHLGDSITRLGHLGTDAGAGCKMSLVGPHAYPARVLLSPDGRHAEIEPFRPLRAGRRYAVVLEGLSGAATSSAKNAAISLPDEIGSIRRDKTGAFLARMSREQEGISGTTTFAGVRVKLPHELRGEDLTRLHASFVPRKHKPVEGAVTSIETLDARAGLLEYRTRLGAIPCPATPPRLASSPPLPGQPNGALSLVGRYTSLDISANPPPVGTRSDPKAAATASEHTFDLILPERVSDTTPLVIAVDGHMGSSDRILARHGAELLAANMAVLSFDIPYHGSRAELGINFVTPLDPSRLSRNMRQAAVDVLAIVRQALACGFPLPDGRIYRPTNVRYLGYSLGSMIGSIARSVEPDLGSTVLLAPGADLIGWLMLHVGPQLGARYVSCLGGPEHGNSCFDDGLCAPPGNCVADPFFEQLSYWIKRPYALASGAGDPLSFATERTGEASKSPLLLITGGNDIALYPALASRLADAYGMRVSGPYERRGPNARFVQWPALAHDLQEHDGARRQAHEFLISDGRRLLPTEIAE